MPQDWRRSPPVESLPSPLDLFGGILGENEEEFLDSYSFTAIAARLLNSDRAARS